MANNIKYTKPATILNDYLNAASGMSDYINPNTGDYMSLNQHVGIDYKIRNIDLGTLTRAYINDIGVNVSNSQYGATDYIDISRYICNDLTMEVLTNYGLSSWIFRVAFYDENNTFIGFGIDRRCSSVGDFSFNTVIPENAKYLKACAINVNTSKWTITIRVD